MDTIIATTFCYSMLILTAIKFVSALKQVQKTRKGI